MKSFFGQGQRTQDYAAVPQGDADRPSSESERTLYDYYPHAEAKTDTRASKSSSTYSTGSAQTKRSSSVARSTASSVSVNAIEVVHASRKPQPFPKPDLAAGTRNHIHGKSIPIQAITWVQWSNTTPLFTISKGNRQHAPCCFVVQAFLRGQAMFQQPATDPDTVSGCMPLSLVENFISGPRSMFDTPGSTWMKYFDKLYPGWDWVKPDWRGPEYIAHQQNRICSDWEIYDLRYSKWRTRIQVYGYKLRIKQH